jgi:hypothetical protein
MQTRNDALIRLTEALQGMEIVFPCTQVAIGVFALFAEPQRFRGLVNDAREGASSSMDDTDLEEILRTALEQLEADDLAAC